MYPMIRESKDAQVIKLVSLYTRIAKPEKIFCNFETIIKEENLKILINHITY